MYTHLWQIAVYGSCALALSIRTEADIASKLFCKPVPDQHTFNMRIEYWRTSRSEGNSEQGQLPCTRDCSGSAFDIKFSVNIVQMPLHSCLAQKKLVGDLFVRHSDFYQCD